jgi:hypothetical protein
MTATIAIANIIRSAGTQFRVNMCDENIADLISLIEDGVKFHTPIILASFNDRLYLTDGFHRVSAYLRSDITEIPADQCHIVPCGSIEDVRLMAMKANVAHGKVNTEADYCLMIQQMIEINADKYMKNAFEVDLKEICTAIGIARTKVEKAHGRYIAPGSTQTLSQQNKAKRDAAIMEQHAKGLSSHKIAAMFGMNQKTVSNCICELSKNEDSSNLLTPSNETTAVPLASTERGTDTLDPNGIDLSDLSHIIDQAGNDEDADGDFSLSGDWSEFQDCPFSLTEDAGFTAEQPTHTKPTEYEQVQDAKVSPVVLQERYMATIEKVEFLGKQIINHASQPMRLDTLIKSLTEATAAMHRDQRIAAQAGISLPE